MRFSICICKVYITPRDRFTSVVRFTKTTLYTIKYTYSITCNNKGFFLGLNTLFLFG